MVSFWVCHGFSGKGLLCTEDGTTFEPSGSEDSELKGLQCM